MAESPIPKRKIPITRILLPAVVIVIVMICGGGYLVLDYEAGSYTNIPLPNTNGGRATTVSVNQRGLFANSVPVANSDGVVTATLRGNEVRVTSTEVTRNDTVVVTIPSGTTSIELDTYCGTTSVSADGELLTTFR